MGTRSIDGVARRRVKQVKEWAGSPGAARREWVGTLQSCETVTFVIQFSRLASSVLPVPRPSSADSAVLLPPRTLLVPRPPKRRFIFSFSDGSCPGVPPSYIFRAAFPAATLRYIDQRTSYLVVGSQVISPKRKLLGQIRAALEQMYGKLARYAGASRPCACTSAWRC